MRKALRVLSVFSIVAIVFSSCTSSNPLSFNKRKYTPGYFANPSGSVETVAQEAKPAKSKVAVNAMQQVKQLVTPKTIVQKQSQTGTVIADKKVKANSGTLNIKEPEVFAKSKRSNNYYSVEDTIEQYNKDKKVNSILGVTSLVTATAGVALLLSQVVLVGGILILIGFVLSMIGIRRGSSSLFTLFGFIVSIIGAVILTFILIELLQ